MASQTTSGTVKWFNEGGSCILRYRESLINHCELVRGHGFITPDDGGADVFVRHTNVIGRGLGRSALREGDRVTYSIEDTERGPSATWVERIEV